MEDLEGGVSSLWLGLGDGRIPVESLPDVLAETYLDLAPIVLDAGPRFAEAAEAYLDVAAGRGVPAGALAGCLGADPLGVLARTGIGGRRPGAAASRRPAPATPPTSPPPGLAAADLARAARPTSPAIRAIVVDALPYHEAGGTDAEELGCSLAAGLEYLRAMRAAGLLRRGGVRAARVPLRGNRRPVRDDRQAAGRPPGLGPGRPAVRGHVRRRRPVAARGQLLVDADPPRPVEQHPARHPGLFLGRRRRRRRDHRRSLRRRDRAAGPAGPPGRPQRPRPAGRGVPRRPGDRPGGRVLVRRGPHRAARGQGLGLVPGDRAVGRAAGGAGGRARLRPAGGQPRAAAGRAGADGGRPSPGSASSRWSARPCSKTAGPASRRPASRRLAVVCHASAGRSGTRSSATAPTSTPWPPGRRRRSPWRRLTPRGRASAQAERVTALLAPGGIKTVTVVSRRHCAATPDAPRPRLSSSAEAPTPARTRSAPPWTGPAGQGASTVVVAAGDPQAPVPGAAERIIDDMDVLAFCGPDARRARSAAMTGDWEVPDFTGRRAGRAVGARPARREALA